MTSRPAAAVDPRPSVAVGARLAAATGARAAVAVRTVPSVAVSPGPACAMGMRPGPARRRPDAGLASIEFAILLPVFILLILLATFLGRRSIAQTQVDLAAQDAARAASIARTSDAATRAAHDAAAATLAAAGSPCTGGYQVDLNVGPADPWHTVPLGQPVSVTATITCRVDVGDLASPLQLKSATITLTSSFSTPVDQYRTRS